MNSRWFEKKVCDFKIDPYYWLFSSSLIYLFFPFLLFIIGWLHWYLWVPCAAMLLYQLVSIIKTKKPSPTAFTITRGKAIEIFLIFLSIFIWVYLSGVNSIGHQTGDFLKHNAVLYDLTTQDWPVGYYLDTAKTQTSGLVYYIAYYLPAGLFGKLFSYQAATQFIFIWCLAGIFLGLGWCFLLLKKANLKITLLFIFFSGIDLLGILLSGVEYSPSHDRVEWWAEIWQYSANTSLLYWVPQHAISGWVLAGIFCYEILHYPKEKNLIFYFSLSALWSGFVMLGLIPFLLFGLVKDKLRNLVSWSTVAGMLILVICGLYYHARFPDHYKSFLWESHDLLATLPLLALFLLVEFALYALIAGSFVRKTYPEFFALFLVGCITLCLLPFYSFGRYNDFVMRGSIPALFILQIGVYQFLEYARPYRAARGILVTLLLVGALAPCIQILRSIIHHRTFPPLPVISLVNIEPRLSIQYLGNEHSAFFKFLSRKPHIEITIPEELRQYPLFKEQMETLNQKR